MPYVERYVMDKRTLHRLLTSRGVEELICAHRNCDKPILVDQPVVSKQGKRVNAVYHEECYDGSYVA